MVFREWHRHRTQSYNEASARYTPLPDENYVPTIERLLLGGDGKNRQAGTIAATPAVANAVIDGLKHLGVKHIDMPMTPERVWRAMNPS